MAVRKVGGQRRYDETSTFEEARYISASEAVWRLLQFDIIERHPTVSDWMYISRISILLTSEKIMSGVPQIAETWARKSLSGSLQKKNGQRPYISSIFISQNILRGII